MHKIAQQQASLHTLRQVYNRYNIRYWILLIFLLSRGYPVKWWLPPLFPAGCWLFIYILFIYKEWHTIFPTAVNIHPLSCRTCFGYTYNSAGVP